MNKVEDRIWELITKWRCEASEFGDRFRSQVGYNIDAEDGVRCIFRRLQLLCTDQFNKVDGNRDGRTKQT